MVTSSQIWAPIAAAQSAQNSFTETMDEGDVQWYQINMPSAGLLSVNVKSDGDFIMSITVYDPAGREVGSKKGSYYSGQISVDVQAVMSGAYKVEVTLGGLPYGRAAGQVTASSNVAMTRISEATSSAPMSPGDAQWFDIQVSEPSFVSVNAVADHNNMFEISLYDPNGLAIADEKTSSYDGSMTLTRSVSSPGTYKYKVTLGGLPYGSTTSAVHVSGFVIPLQGIATGPAASPSPAATGSPTPAASTAPTTTPPVPTDAPGLPAVLPLAALMVIGAVVLASAGYVGVKVLSRPGKRPSRDVLAPAGTPSGDQAQASSIDVFISYSAQDKNVADAVCHGLESNRIRCWIAPRDVVVGKSFEESIFDAIGGARILLLIFSSHSNSSPHVENEVRLAWKRGIPIIPFRLEDVPFNHVIDYYIGSRHWLDGMTPPLEQHIDELAQKVKVLLAQGDSGAPKNREK